MPVELKQMSEANITDFEPRFVNLRELSMGAQIRDFASEGTLYMRNAIWSSSRRMLQRLFRISESMSPTELIELIPSTVDYYLDHHSACDY